MVNRLRSLLYERDRYSKSSIVIRGLVGYTIGLSSIIPVALIGLLICSAFGLDFKVFSSNYSPKEGLIDSYGLPLAIVIISLAGPILEELMMRLGLSFKKWHVSLSLSLFANMLINSFVELAIYHSVAIIAALFFVIIALTKQQFWSMVSQRYGGQIIMISIIVFGLMHITNYDVFDIKLLPLYTLFTIPVMCLGVVFTYFRLNLGFVYGCLLHIFNNSVFMLISL